MESPVREDAGPAEGPRGDRKNDGEDGDDDGAAQDDDEVANDDDVGADDDATPAGDDDAADDDTASDDDAASEGADDDAAQTGDDDAAPAVEPEPMVPVCAETAALSALDAWIQGGDGEPASETLHFEVQLRPTADQMDGLVAIGDGPVANFSEAAISVRFADTGFVEARDGQEYTSRVEIPYEAGLWYRLVIDANVADRTYDASIGPCDGNLTNLIRGASFRNGVEIDGALSAWAAWSSDVAALELAEATWGESGGGECVPTTCEALGATCGAVSDGCSQTLQCGSCASGESCVEGACSAASPLPPAPTCQPTPSECGTPDVVVSSADELSDALAESTGGEVISLEAGEYGNLRLRGQAYDDYVTICGPSSDPDAVFTAMNIENSSYVRIHNIRVASEEAGSEGTSIAFIGDGSHHIELLNSEIHGTLDDDFRGHRIIDVADASDILVQGNYVHNGLRGIVMASSENLQVIGNRFEDLGDDDMKLLNLNGVQIENNVGARRKYPTPQAHLDFIQGQATCENVVIRGNVSLPENSFSQQGIFLSDATYHNVLIENNVIYVGLIRALQVNGGSTDVTVRYNTVLDIPDDNATPASEIFVPDDATLEYNISTYIAGDTGTEGTNLVIQNEDSGRNHYVDDYYVNGNTGTGIVIEDLAAVPGSAAETAGAFERINQLINGVELPACE